MKATRAPFGTLDDGTVVEAVTLANTGGVTATVITLGATLQALILPDRDGTCDDVVLGYESPEEYRNGSAFFGASIGRYANRIARGRFTLDGVAYQLPINDPPNCLHGGDVAFDKLPWTIESISDGPPASVVLRYRSADGEAGFPGNMDVTATYRLDAENQLTIDYAGVTDAPTIVNLTNHSYFNLGGARSGRSALDAMLTLHAERYTPVDSTMIPTGAIADVAGTPFDFRTARRIADRVRDGSCEQLQLAGGYDHNVVIDGAPGTLRPAARLADPVTGRVVEIHSTAPGMQFYSGNSLDGKIRGKGDLLYRQGDGVAFEPQAFPDTPNQSDFGSVRLDPGEHYHHRIVYRFSTVSA